MLYIVPTPVGNLKDITLKSLEVLREVDGIICEDTRHTALLLNHYQIKKPLLVLNDFNENTTYPRILEKLKNGENLAMVSDGGTPLISDPGYKLVRACLESELPVDSLPGPTSITVALILSGLPPDKFLFLGYPPEKSGPRIKLLQNLMTTRNLIKVTSIMFVSPHKLIKTLTDIEQIFGDTEVVLAKELTKIYQEVKKQTVHQWLEYFSRTKPRGEYILLF